jgi:hypothetical protein
MVNRLASDLPVGDPPVSPEERRDPPPLQSPLGEPPPPHEPEDPPLDQQPPIGDPMPAPQTPEGDPPDSSRRVQV